jgi:hypothetical protein
LSSSSSVSPKPSAFGSTVTGCALAVDADVDDVLLVDLELEPRATRIILASTMSFSGEVLSGLIPK